MKRRRRESYCVEAELSTPRIAHLASGVQIHLGRAHQVGAEQLTPMTCKVIAEAWFGWEWDDQS